MRQCAILAAIVLCVFTQSPSWASFVMPAKVLVTGIRLVDNGDNDGFADPNETVSVFVTLKNNSGTGRSNIVVLLSSTDPTVDCIPTPQVAFGSLAAGEIRESATAATFRVANVVRMDAFASLTASLDFHVSGDGFGTTAQPQRRVLDLDLNVSGGILPTSFTEGFETGTLGAFTSMTLDTGLDSVTLSDGYRCQYNDPDGPNPNTSTNSFCFLGAATPADNGYDWHAHGTGSPEGGRAYLGSQSLHWGMHPSAVSPGLDTTRLRQLDAIRLNNPVNLGWNGVASEMSFKHQVGLTDCDYVSCDEGGNLDRGVVQLQLANSAGAGVGSWRNIPPYENVYDAQTMDNYTNCLFDPTDDGNDEDDYFEPTDPDRRLGPSSTCHPEFSFSRVGAIFFSDAFDPADIHHASDGPGLQGSRGPGTWVESRFDLSRYRGRRVRLRFLTSSIEVGNAVDWQQVFGWNPIEADDGWYIDDVRVTNTTTGPSTVAVDAADRSGLPACGPVCGSVTASLTATPPGPVGPGEPVTLDASGSTADVCPGGALHYKFWVDWNGNGEPDERVNSLIQDWGTNAIVTHTSTFTVQYGVLARCSTRPACSGGAFVTVPFECPSINPVPFQEPILFDSDTQVSWPGFTIWFDVLRGDLDALRASGGQFNGTVQTCLANDSSNAFFSDVTEPEPGLAFYYLVRDDAQHVCGFGAWTTGSPAELPGVGGTRDEDLPLDPDTCPTRN